MPKTARIVIPGAPHHIIQRGNRRQDVFFEDADYRIYLSLIKEKCEENRVKILSYCLMSNHVHLIAVPETENGLRALGEAHRRYTWYINNKHDWRGYLWQGRFSSYPMDDQYLYEAVRYVELNPVRAGLCQHPADYRWSSARQRLSETGRDDYKVSSLDHMIEDWKTYWNEGLAKYKFVQKFEENESKQAPLGDINPKAKAVGAQ